MRTVFHQDGRQLTIVRSDDCQDVLDRNAMLRSQPQRSDFLRHTASIPTVIIEKWLNEEFQRGNRGIRWGSKEFDQIIFKKLRDPEWSYLRVDK